MRVPRDSKLETREGRKPIANAGDVYWKSLGHGLAVGYRRGRWWVRERTEGRYRKRSLGEADDFADADGQDVLSYRDACRLAYAGPEAQEEAAAGAYTVSNAMVDYLAWFRAHRKDVHTTTIRINRHILPKLGDRPVEKLTSRELREWHEAIANAPAGARSAKAGPRRTRPIDPSIPERERKRRRKASANRTLTILKAALSHAFREGSVDSDLAWRRVKPFREVDVPRVRYLSRDEARRLVNACSGDFRSLVRGALMSGCRYGELRFLRVEDFDAAAGTIRIRESKGGKPRSIPLTDEGRELLETLTAGRTGGEHVFRRADGKPWEKSQQKRRMRDACATAKIEPEIRFNDLRHTYASLLAQRGVTLQVIAEVLGHADTRMTSRHYAHLVPSYVAETVRANLPRFTRKRPAKVRGIR
jgi:integrase